MDERGRKKLDKKGVKRMLERRMKRLDTEKNKKNL